MLARQLFTVARAELPVLLVQTGEQRQYLYSRSGEATVSLARKAFAGARWVSLSSLVSNGLQLLQLTLLARLLPPQDFGIVALATVVVGFAQAYTDMGMGNVIIHRQDATHRQLSSLYWLNVLTGVAIFCSVQILAPILAELWRTPALTGSTFWSNR